MKRYALVRSRTKVTIHKLDTFDTSQLYFIREFSEYTDEYADSIKLQNAYRKYYKID